MIVVLLVVSKSLSYGRNISLYSTLASLSFRVLFALARRLLATPRRIPAKRMGPPLSTRGLKGCFE